MDKGVDSLLAAVGLKTLRHKMHIVESRDFAKLKIAQTIRLLFLAIFSTVAVGLS